VVAVFQLADLLAGFAKQNADAVTHLVERHDLKVEGELLGNYVKHHKQCSFMDGDAARKGKSWAIKLYANRFVNGNRQRAQREIGSEERREGGMM
jgi:hypothetical protein